MRSTRLAVFVALIVSAIFIVILACKPKEPPPARPDVSGMKRYGEDPKMKELTTNPFPGMDGIAEKDLSAEEISGRVLWNLWSGDTYLMWDYLAKNGFGTSDLLKIIDSRNRATRFDTFGTINQPGFMTASKADEYGIYLDVPRPGDQEGDIDKRLNIDEYTYGRSSGVVGLRIFPNPEFKGAAISEWKKHIAADGVNHDYYENPNYYNKKTLVRPYAVGMACAFCHVSFDPVRPPENTAEPRWVNLNDYVGAQYLKVWEVFGSYMKGDSFVKQLLQSNPQGTLDTSFIATDYLNNPGTMNAVYSWPQRLSRSPMASTSATAGHEMLGGGALELLNIRKEIATGKYPVPRVLKMGEDSVGVDGALSRVFINIGESWNEWSKHFRPLVGGPDHPQTPVEVKTLQTISSHWNWSEKRSPHLKTYLVNRAQPLLLKDAPGGDTYLTKDQKQLDRGKLVFAQNCARCHSSKQPPEPTDPASAEGTKWFVDHINSDPAFFTDNFLSDERRHSVAEIGTNATRAAATNAIRGHIWDNFSSETYKTLPAVATLNLPSDPLEGDPNTTKTFAFTLPANGPGWYRPPSLISLWSSAPYLHNNTVGSDFGDPTVKGRMRAFQEGIERMLLIQKRQNIVWRTKETSYITIPSSYAPPLLRKLISRHELQDADGNLRIGPIPKGTPVNLLSNVNLEGDPLKLLQLGVELSSALIEIDAKHMNDQQAAARMRKVIPLLMAVNKCPDFIEDKGHKFGTQLPRADKLALIELLKTF
ncbi:MAG: hypothetical protein JWO97_4556 [Acidobacteria bacterium]|nr:hypothetical protein [Acidobacteriota bacterium]